MKPVALITGSSSGFGLLIAVALAQAGHRVFASMRDLGRRAALDEASSAAGVTLETVQLDVNDPASIAAAVGHVEAQAGRVSVLVNNAGFALGGFFEDTSDGELRAQLETNFFGLTAVTRAVLPGMRAQGRGRIINISSSTGLVPNPGYAAYSASKHAVEGWSEALRHELRRFGIQVVLIEPGTYPTDCCSRNKCVAEGAGAEASPYQLAMQRWEAVMGWIVARANRDPGDVARAVVRAAEIPRPRLRYPLGWDTRLQLLGKAVLPERAFEAVVRWVFAG
jgi:NAD(P)-dependent dehydrogenase (short-subunit alcohol dehydrogenase family)